MISDNLVKFIKKGFEPKAKKCPAGLMTIGYGHQILSTLYLDEDGFISKKDAHNILINDLFSVHEDIVKELQIMIEDINKMEALISLVYNWGIGNFRKSKLLYKLNNKDYKGAADEFLDIRPAA